MSLEAHFKAWEDLASGIALLYMGPGGQADEFTERLIAAMESKNLDEIVHLTALMLLRVKNAEVHHRWHELDHVYHAEFCRCV